MSEPGPGAAEPRCRARDLGISLGRYRPGRWNAITDVTGVKVGHSTIIRGAGQLKMGRGPVRTGVTVILPNPVNTFEERVVGGGFVLNGAGEVSGMTQLMEWGLIETPIFLTNTLSVGAVSDAAVQWMVEKYPGIGETHDVIIPLVGECDDSWLNDIAGRHVKEQHVREAISTASDGPVAEGSVGGGTGMITCDFKAGIGTSSRKLPEKLGGYTVGVLVMSNFGVMEQLRVGGLPIGEILEPRWGRLPRREQNYGSIIAVIATDAPLITHQLNRLAKRAALGIGRVGSTAMHGSGEIILAFSTANMVPRETRKMVYRVKILLDQRLDPLYEAVIEATEEAILNALCMARDMDGVNGNLSRALPLSEVRDVVSLWQRQLDAGKKAAASQGAVRPPQAQVMQVRPPQQRDEPGRRDSGALVTAALAKPTAVRGAEGMPLPLRPSVRPGGEWAASAGQVGPGQPSGATSEGQEPSPGVERDEKKE